jgi:hypothetical protein
MPLHATTDDVRALALLDAVAVVVDDAVREARRGRP